MTFSALKAEILNRLKLLEITEAYQAVLISTDYNSLLQAVAPMVEYFYQAGIIDNSLFPEFPGTDLNTNGIYTTSTSLTNPAGPLCFLGGTSTLTLTGNANRKVKVLGDTYLTINLSGNAQVNLKVYDAAVVTINSGDSSSVIAEGQQTAHLIANLIGGSVMDGTFNGGTLVDYNGGGASFAMLKLVDDAILNYTLNDSAGIDPRSYHNSIINSGPL